MKVVFKMLKIVKEEERLKKVLEVILINKFNKRENLKI